MNKEYEISNEQLLIRTAIPFQSLRKEEGLPLFSGRIEKLACNKENRLLTVQIYGIGETAKLDREKKKQSFP